MSHITLRKEVSDELYTNDMEKVNGMDIMKFIDEIEDIKDIELTCLKCGEERKIKNLVDRGWYVLHCPECNNTIFGIKKEDDWKIMREMLRGGDRDEYK